MKTKLSILFLIFSILLTSGFGCKFADKETQQAMKPVTLEYWRVWDGPDAFDEIISKYKQLHPYVTINYKKLRYEEYEKELINALAEDRGPDIFSIHNTWVRKYESKIVPLPSQTKVVYKVMQGTIKKELVDEMRTEKSLTVKDVRDKFIDVVGSDVIIEAKDPNTNKTSEQIFGLPLSVDTLAMFYNKTLLNTAGIAVPPATWVDVQEAVKKLTFQNSKGELVQSGIALGGSKNIERYTDILSVLMMQNGAIMANKDNYVMFDVIPPNIPGLKESPGLQALRFYTDFANPFMEVYSWNTDLPNSLDMFIQGNLAIFFGYAYHIPTIETRNPKLNFSYAPLPQILDNPEINVANYWLETVSNKSKNSDIAWNFLQFSANEENVTSYLNKTKKPTALRSLVSEQVVDETLGIFAKQLLTAQSWYHGADSNAMEIVFADMIDSAVKGESELEKIIRQAANQVQETIK